VTGNEEDVIRYYERFWSKSELWWETDKTLGIHLGYYDKGIHSHTDAVLYMNEIAWRLLNLKSETPGKILDAGCGVGGTSIYLAQKYPQMFFTGITIVPTHVVMAERFAKKRNVTANTRFLEQSYCQTTFPDNSYDGIIALESVIYAHKDEDLIKELYRVLKPGGRIAIIDGFRTDKPIPRSLNKIYKIWLDGRALINVEPVNEFAACMKQKGFRDVMVSDISSHVISSYFFGVLVGSVLFIPALTKAIIRFRHHDYNEDFNCFMAVSLAAALLALYGCFKYYSVTATK
jgi:tocopherol O-methyltransferase